jgi:hypothetical protein
MSGHPRDRLLGRMAITKLCEERLKPTTIASTLTLTTAPTITLTIASTLMTALTLTLAIASTLKRSRMDSYTISTDW